MEKVAIFVVLTILISSAVALYILGPSITGMFIGFGQPTGAEWWNVSWNYRTRLDINSTQYSRTDWPVEININFTDMFPSGTFDINSTRVIEYDQAGSVIQEVPSQFDQGENFDASNNAVGTIVFSMNGSTSANTNRTFYVYYDIIENGAKDSTNYQTNLSYSWDGQFLEINNTRLRLFLDTNRGDNTSGLYRVEDKFYNVVFYAGASERTAEYIEYSNGTHNMTFDLINNASFTNGSVRVTVEQNGDENIFGNPSQKTNEATISKKYYVYNKAGPESRGTFIKIVQRVTNSAGYQIQRNSTLSGALALDVNRTFNSGYINSQDANTTNPFSWAWATGDGGEATAITNLNQTGTSNYFVNNNSYTTGRIGIELSSTSIDSGSYIEQVSLVYLAPIGGSDAVTEFLNIKNSFETPIAISQSLPERWYVLTTTTTNETVYNRNETMLITGNISGGDPYNLTEYMNATLDMGTADTGDDQTIILYDDGSHEDGAAQDKVFANVFGISNSANVSSWTINFTTYTNNTEFLNWTAYSFNVTDILNLNVSIANKNPLSGSVVVSNIDVRGYRNDTWIPVATINCNYNSTEVTNKTDFNNGTYSVNFTAPVIGDYILYCNATKNGNFGNNSDTFTSESTTTNVSITNQPSDVNVTNITLHTNDTFVISSNASNIGNGTAYSLNISLELLAGWDANETLENCGDVNKAEFCERAFNITVPNGTSPGNYYVNVSANWTNPDNTTSYNKTFINVTVASNPKVNVSEANLTGEASVGNELTVGNFTVLSIGNDALQNVSFSCIEGEVCDNFTVEFIPSNISSLSVNGNYSVAVNVSVPLSYLVGNYTGVVNVSASNDGYDNVTLIIILPPKTNLSTETTPTNQTVSNITQDVNETFSFTANITDIGNGSARYVNISLVVEPGWVPNTSLQSCNNLTKYEFCERAFNITVPNGTSPGNYYVNVSANWTNPDGTMGTNMTLLNVTVVSNALINVTEDLISGTVADANSSVVGNFTVLSIGNDALQNVSFSCIEGEVCDNFTVEFIPSNISSLSVNGNYSVAVNVSVPLSYLVGNYTGVVNVSASNDGYDNVTLNISVPSNRTWNMTPVLCEKPEDPPSGTACEIKVMNLGNDDINFTISPQNGNYTEVNVTNFTVSSSTNYTFNVTYNVSNISYGIYNSLFVVDSVQSDANPDNMTLNVTLLPYLPPIINFSIVPNFTEQNSTIEFFVNLTDRSDSGIAWVNVSVTKPDNSTNQTNMTLLNESGNFSQWYLNYSSTLGDTDSIGVYTVTVSTSDIIGNIGNLTKNFTIYKKTLVTSTTLSGLYYQGDTGSIYFIIKNETGQGVNGTNVNFTIRDPNNNITYYSSHQTDSEGTIAPMPTFILSSDAPIGTYTLTADYDFYDDVLNQTLNVQDNSTFDVQTRTVTVTGLFADIETSVVWYPNNIMKFGILVYNGEGSPVDPDYMNFTVYDPADNEYFSVTLSSMTKEAVGYYTYSHAMGAGTPTGMYLGVLNVTQGTFETKKLEAFRVSQGGPYDVRISLFENEVPQGDYLDFALIVENKGEVTQDVFVEYNVSSDDQTYYYSTEAVLTPAYSNQSFTRNVYIYSDQPLGNYILNAKVTYSSIQQPINSNVTFTVTSALEIEQPPAPAPSGQPTFYVVEPTPRIEASILLTGYNNNVSLARGLTKIENVVVKNTGSVNLNNVSLFILGIPTDWFTISPASYVTLVPDNSSIFLVEFNIPDNANVGSYRASLLAVSGVVSDQKNIDVNIYSSVAELLEDEIAKLEAELINLKVDIKLAERDGKDVSNVLTFVDTIESYIEEAKEFIRKGDLEAAMEKVSSSLTLIKKARDILDSLEVPAVTPFLSIWVVLILLIIIIVIVFIVVYFWKKKKLKPMLRPYIIKISRLVERAKSKEVDKGKLEAEKEKALRMLKVLEKEKSEGLVTSSAYNKMKKSLEKKLEEIDKKIK